MNNLDSSRFEREISQSDTKAEQLFWALAHRYCRAEGVGFKEFTSRNHSSYRAGKVHLHIYSEGQSALLKREFQADYLGLPEYLITERIDLFNTFKSKTK